MDALISLKDKLLVELLRIVVLWSVWRERNNIIFNGVNLLCFKALGTKIITLPSFWCQSRYNDSYLKLTMILRSDVKDLPEHVTLE